MSNRSTQSDTEPEKWALARRDFLVLGSAAVVSAAASSLTANTIRVVASPATGSVLSVGYVEPAVATENAAVDSRVTGARSLRLMDDGFRHGSARVRIHGFSRPAGSDSPLSVRVSTFAPVASSPLPFLAWTHSEDGRGRTQKSRSSSFVAALDAEGTLPIAIERVEPVSRHLSRFLPAVPSTAALPELAALEQGGSVCRLSNGNGGHARLRPGTYFIALRCSSYDRQPDWSSIAADRTPAAMTDVLRRGGRPVDFEYVALTIDHSAV
jgi:hypothetical protein